MAKAFRRRRRDGSRAPKYTGFYRDATGRQRSFVGWSSKRKTLEKARELELKHREIREGVRAMPSADLARAARSIESVIADYLAWGRERGGRRGRGWDEHNAGQKARYLSEWCEALGLRTLADIRLADVERHEQHLLANGRDNGPLAPKSVELSVEPLRALCRWAVKRGLLEADPLAARQRLDTSARRGRHRDLSEDEVRALLEHADPQRALAYRVALATGYRVGELLHVRACDLDAGALACRAAHTKNRRPARQPLPADLAAVLREHARLRPPEGQLVLVHRGGWRSTCWRRDLEAAGIPRATEGGRTTWHSLRVRYINRLIAAGCDLKTIQELARHSTAQLSLEIYGKRDPDRLRAAVERVTNRLHAQMQKPAEQGARRVSGIGVIGFEPQTHVCKRPSGAVADLLEARLQGRHSSTATPSRRTSRWRTDDGRATPFGLHAGLHTLDELLVTDPSRELADQADRLGRVLRGGAP